MIDCRADPRAGPSSVLWNAPSVARLRRLLDRASKLSYVLEACDMADDAVIGLRLIAPSLLGCTYQTRLCVLPVQRRRPIVRRPADLGDTTRVSPSASSFLHREKLSPSLFLFLTIIASFARLSFGSSVHNTDQEGESSALVHSPYPFRTSADR